MPHLPGRAHGIVFWGVWSVHLQDIPLFEPHDKAFACSKVLMLSLHPLSEDASWYTLEVQDSTSDTWPFPGVVSMAEAAQGISSCCGTSLREERRQSLTYLSSFFLLKFQYATWESFICPQAFFPPHFSTIMRSKKKILPSQANF